MRLIILRKVSNSYISTAKEEFMEALKIDPISSEAETGLLKAKIFELLNTKGYDPAVVQQRLINLQTEVQDDPRVHLNSLCMKSIDITAILKTCGELVGSIL
ncbi:MAG: hypothetical protein ABI723_17025 [Bacteroidia bacterium]